MLKLLAAAALAMGLAFVPSVRAADSGKKLSGSDTKFVKNAATGGEMEVALGKVAADKASSDDVKKFGQRMVDDHTKANDQLKQLAEQKGVDLTKAIDNGKKKAQKQADKLSSASGAAFDKAYMKMMVADHEKDVKEFKEAAENAKDEDLKKWASDTLPTLEDHLKMAKEIQSNLGK